MLESMKRSEIDGLFVEVSYDEAKLFREALSKQNPEASLASLS